MQLTEREYKKARKQAGPGNAVKIMPAVDINSGKLNQFDGALRFFEKIVEAGKLELEEEKLLVSIREGYIGWAYPQV